MTARCAGLLGGLLAVMSLLGAAQTATAQDDLAKASQNPLGTVISVPFENNFNFNAGPEDELDYILNLKPVYPVTIGDWNLINRPIVPIIYQGERFSGQGREFGLGDVNYQAFFSPAKPAKIIWGVGPSLVVPTATSSRLGSDKWSVGPAAVVLATPGPWVIGALAQNVWSFAGDSDTADVNSFLFQYFINYNLPDGWYLTSTPTITADWEASSSQRWTVPFGAGVGRLVRFGKQPVDFKLIGFWNSVKPDNTAEGTLQFQVKFLFPK